MLFLFRLILACGCLMAPLAHAQTTSLKVGASNSQKLSELTPPPARYLPTVYLLQDPGIQATLAINAQQRARIGEVGKSVRDPQLLSQMGSTAHDFPEFSQVADSEQRKQLEARAACQLHVSHLLESEVLSAEQLERFNQLRIRLCGMVYFLNQQSTSDLSITPQQRSMILEQHSRLMRESNALVLSARKEINRLSGTEKAAAQQALNKRIGDLERQGVTVVVSRLDDSQQAQYARLVGPPTELCRESLVMKIALEALDAE